MLFPLREDRKEVMTWNPVVSTTYWLQAIEKFQIRLNAYFLIFKTVITISALFAWVLVEVIGVVQHMGQKNLLFFLLF